MYTLTASKGAHALQLEKKRLALLGAKQHVMQWQVCVHYTARTDPKHAHPNGSSSSSAFVNYPSGHWCLFKLLILQACVRPEFVIPLLALKEHRLCMKRSKCCDLRHGHV